jgi:large subunit ribosomal protein L4
MDIKVTKLAGKAAGSVEVSDEVFGLEPRADMLQRMVRWQLAKRQTGNAQDQGPCGDRPHGRQVRQAEGWRAVPVMVRAALVQFVGGGKAHGPVALSHAHDLPKKVRALACAMRCLPRRRAT